MITQEQENTIIKLRIEGKNINEIANLLNINNSQVKYTINNSKIDKDKMDNTDFYFSPKEIEFLKENYTERGAAFCSHELNRKLESINYKVRQLKLKRFVNKDAPDGFAWCKQCKRFVKNEFISIYISNKGTKGKRMICKSCSNEQRNSFLDVKRNNPKYRRDELVRTIVKSKRRAAKLKNMPFDLDYQWVNKNLVKQCPILHKDFEFPDKKAGSYSNYAVSVDRIDNSKGYTKDNCILVCRRANMIKNDASSDELMIIAKFYKNLEEERSQIEYYI